MTKPFLPLLLCVLAAGTTPARAEPPAPPPSQGQAPAAAPTADEQLARLEASCAASATARAGRQVQAPLYRRLRGEPGIHALTREIVRLHLQNPPIRRHFEKLDPDAVAKHVAEFMISGTGGPQVYHGPDLTTSHRALKLTNGDFVLAGGDVVQAMKNLKYGQDEIDEVVCTLVSLRPQVVLAQQASGSVPNPQEEER
jgi:hemoglobin